MGYLYHLLNQHPTIIIKGRMKHSLFKEYSPSEIIELWKNDKPVINKQMIYFIYADKIFTSF